MMYRTRVASTRGKICTDTSGAQLICIGNINANTGDYVWTDGKSVYGSQQEGECRSHAVFNYAGVPLIDNDGGKYVSRKGILKEINCTNPDGYVYANNDTDVVLSSGSVLDAEISADKEPQIYTIVNHAGILSDIVYNHSLNIEKYYYLGYENASESYSTYSDEANPENNYSNSSSSNEKFNTADKYYDNNETPLSASGSIDICKNGKIIGSISAGAMVSMANGKFMAKMEQAANIESGAAFPPGRSRPTSMIDETMLSVQSAKIDRNGNYEIIVAAVCRGTPAIWRNVQTCTWKRSVYDMEKHYDAQWYLHHWAYLNTMHHVIHRKTIDYSNSLGSFWALGTAIYTAYIKIRKNSTEIVKESSYVYSRSSADYAPFGFYCNMRLGEIKNGNALYVQPGPFGYWEYDSGDCFGWNWNWHQPNDVRYGYYNYDLMAFPAAVMLDESTSKNTRIMVQDSLTALCTISADDAGNAHAIYDGDTLVTNEIVFGATQNLCGCRLNDDEHPLYIIGIHGKGYYIVQDGKVIDQGDGLQNYRLRYMKNLSTFKSALGG